MSFLSSSVSNRTHANGSIKRGNKDNATDMVYLRTGIGVQLKDIKVFNRARQQGGYFPKQGRPRTTYYYKAGVFNRKNQGPHDI